MWVEQNYDAIVVGGDSYIGNRLFHRLLEHNHSVLATTCRKGTMPERDLHWHFCDLLFPVLLPPAKYTFLLAAVSNPQECEVDPWYAEQINVEGTVLVAQRQIDRGGRVLFLSSAEVEHYPQRLFGKLKLKAELELREYCDATCVIRCGPIHRPERPAHADGPYQPLKLDEIVDCLLQQMIDWRPGLQRLTKYASVEK